MSSALRPTRVTNCQCDGDDDGDEDEDGDNDEDDDLMSKIINFLKQT